MYLRFVIGAGGSCSRRRSLLSIAHKKKIENKNKVEQSPSSQPSQSNMEPEMNLKCCRRPIAEFPPDEARDKTN